MDYGRLFIDSSSPSQGQGNMFFMGNNNNPSFRGPSTLILRMEDNTTKKRSFFTSSTDEFIFDEEYYDDQLPEKKRRLTSEQVYMLEKSFEEENKLEPERKIELAKRLGLQPRQVAVWFQNRRARSKTKQLERDHDLLKASYDNLLSNYQALLKDHDLLKSQVHLLTEKLQAREINSSSPSPIPGPINVDQVDTAQISAQQQLSSSSSGASVVVSEDNLKLVVDTGDSTYFDCSSPHPPCNAVVRSTENDITDDDQSCLSRMFTRVVANHLEELDDQDLGWWVWS